jgi:hypothetical protein
VRGVRILRKRLEKPSREGRGMDTVYLLRFYSRRGIFAFFVFIFLWVECSWSFSRTGLGGDYSARPLHLGSSLRDTLRYMIRRILVGYQSRRGSVKRDYEGV